jgi:hypothetical protein
MNVIHRIGSGQLGMVLTDPDTFSAVDAIFFFYDRLAVPDTDSLGRTSLDTIYTPLT